jgi:hypothetical protein
MSFSGLAVLMMPCPMAEYPNAPRLHECLSLDRGATLKSQNGLSLSDAVSPRTFARSRLNRQWSGSRCECPAPGWRPPMETCSSELSADVWHTSRLRRRGLRAVETSRDAACDRTACRHSELGRGPSRGGRGGLEVAETCHEAPVEVETDNGVSHADPDVCDGVTRSGWPGCFLNR